jgi:probable F420-dependent oxidoreductase
MGVVFPDRSSAMRVQRSRVEQLASWGYTDLWAGESDGADAFTPLAVAAGWDTPLRLGTAVVSAFLHPPALLAMRTAAVADVATGGVVLGIGASSPLIVERWNGVPFVDPVAKVRDVAAHVRALLHGERRNGFSLATPPVPAPPVYLAALRPTMLRVARDTADGVILTCIGADDLARITPHLAPAHEVVAWITVCPSADAALVRSVARRRLAGYLAAPAYEAQQRWLDRGDALAGVWEAWRTGGGIDAAAAAVPDEVVDALVVHGDADACRAHIERFVTAGVTTPLLEVLPGIMDVGEAWRRLAPTT